MRLIVVFLALLLTAFLPAVAQAPKAAQASKAGQAKQTPEGDPVITLDVVRVPLLYTVSGKKGRFVSDLKKEDFEVLESKKTQNILEFSAESDLPLRLAVLIDTSNSQRERFKFQQEAATDFVGAMIRAKTDKAAIVSFDTSAELVADLTDDTGLVGIPNHDHGAGQRRLDALRPRALAHRAADGQLPPRRRRGVPPAPPRSRRSRRRGPGNAGGRSPGRRPETARCLRTAEMLSDVRNDGRAGQYSSETHHPHEICSCQPTVLIVPDRI